jgi:undecaprenyl-diphosphatase
MQLGPLGRRSKRNVPVESLLNYLTDHAALAYAAVFLAACLEAVAVIGTAVPGSSIVFVGGLLAGAGVLDARLCAGIAVLGAVLGDGFSYELGRRYRERIYGIWPICRFPGLLQRGADFVHRHGAWSIFLGRFATPVRAIVPVIAGISAMRRARFYAWNLVSALAWVSAHLVPGVLLGASIQLAGAVSSRLLALALVLLLLLWAAYAALRALLGGARNRWRGASDRLLRWAETRPGIVPAYLRTLLDPQKPEALSLLLSALLLLGTLWAFVAILDNVVSNEALVQFDRTAYYLAQGLRSPAVDRFFVAVTELGDTAVAVSISIAVLLYLLWKKSWHTAAYWTAAVAFAECAVAALKHILARARPSAALETYSFPSGHATLSLVIYGFLGYLIVRKLPRTVQIAAGVVVGAFVGLVSLSRIYLGVHWFSDVLAGLALGVSWILLLSIVYRRHVRGEAIRPLPLAMVAVAAFVIAGSLEVRRLHEADLARYAYAPRATVLQLDRWLAQDWQFLPAQRIELDGDADEPFSLQWADNEEDIGAALMHAGWSGRAKWSAAGAVLFLAPNAEIADLPVLPKLHEGRSQTLAFEKLVGPDRRLVLRLWRSEFLVAFPDQALRKPLWVGTVELEQIVRRRSVLSLSDQEADPREALGDLAAASSRIRMAQRASPGRPLVLLVNGR